MPLTEFISKSVCVCVCVCVQMYERERVYFSHLGKGGTMDLVMQSLVSQIISYMLFE